MDKYCVVEKRALGHHAASKARNDIADICAEDGWRPVWVHSWKKNSVWDKLKMLLVTASDWRRVSEHVPDGAELLIQYPMATKRESWRFLFSEI